MILNTAFACRGVYSRSYHYCKPLHCCLNILPEHLFRRSGTQGDQLSPCMDKTNIHLGKGFRKTQLSSTVVYFFLQQTGHRRFRAWRNQSRYTAREYTSDECLCGESWTLTGQNLLPDVLLHPCHLYCVYADHLPSTRT